MPSQSGPQPTDARPAQPHAVEPPQRRTLADGDAIPEELRALEHWVLWRYERTTDGKLTKVPYQVATATSGRRRKASSTNPRMWASLADALTAYHDPQNDGIYSGIGFVVTDDDDLAGVDLDDAVNADTGELTPWAAAIVAELRAYTEISPSGEGLRAFVRGSLAHLIGRKRGNVEMYESGRYLTVTGRHLEGTPDTIEARQAELDSIHAQHIAAPERVTPSGNSRRPAASGHGARLSDADVLESMRSSPKIGAAAAALYDGDLTAHGDDHSAADLALCSRLGFWADYDAAQVDRLFRSSGLMRAKWDRSVASDGTLYGERTIAHALDGHAPGDGYQGSAIIEATADLEPPPRDPTDPGPDPSDTPPHSTPPPATRHAIALRATPDPELATLADTDVGNAERLVYKFGADLRYSPGLGWLVWDGRRFAPDPSELVLRRAMLTIRATLATALDLGDEARVKSLRAHARASERLPRLRAMCELARIDEAIHVTVEKFDADPWIINTESGMVDLRNGALRPHDRAALCTKLAPVRFDPGATHPALDALLDILDADGRAEYLRSVAGQALTGRSVKAAYVAVGDAGTVKSTFADALTAVLGLDAYAVAVEASTLTDGSKYGPTAGGARADLVALRGARLAVAAELPNGGKLSGELLKRLTGNDPITARAPHAREQMTFRPGHTLLMHSNHDPVADWTDDGLRARLRVIPFSVKPEHPDPAIRQALVEDPDARAAFFAWAVVGAVRWHQAHEAPPPEPEVVTATTRSYWADQDPFAVWAEERLDFDGKTTTTTAELTKSYKAWAENAGERPKSARMLGRWLEAQKDERGLTNARTKHARAWIGVRLRGPTG